MKLKKSLWLFLSLALVFSIALAGCSSSSSTTESKKTDNGGSQSSGEEDKKSNEPQYGGNVTVGASGNPTLFNPLYSSDTNSTDINGLIYDTLVASDVKLEPELRMAEDIQKSEDGLTYTVKIKKGIKFHDGEEMTADDVVFTYSIPLNKDYTGTRGSYFKSIESVKKVDDYTVEFKLKEKDAQFYDVGLGFGILPEHILKDVPIKDLEKNEFNYKKPVGTGPFKFVEWKDGEYVKVEAFKDYFGGSPYLDSITYKIVPDGNAAIAQLQAGDITFYSETKGADVETVKGFADASGLRVESGLDLAYDWIGWNQRNPLFKDKKVRQALTMAIDRKAIVDSVMFGEGEVAHVPESPLSWAYSDDVTKFDFDPEKAKQLLEEAGWKDTDGDGFVDKDGKKFSFTLKTRQGHKVREDAAVIIQEQLKAVGIDCKPQLVEWSALVEQFLPPKWDFDAILIGWSVSTFPDVSDIFHSDQIEKGNNFIAYSNPELDKLSREALQMDDREEFKKTYAEIYKIVSEDQPYTFMYYPNLHRAMPKNLGGYEFHPKNDLYNAEKWYLGKE